MTGRAAGVGVVWSKVYFIDNYVNNLNSGPCPVLSYVSVLHSTEHTTLRSRPPNHNHTPGQISNQMRNEKVSRLDKLE